MSRCFDLTRRTTIAVAALPASLGLAACRPTRARATRLMQMHQTMMKGMKM